MEFVKLYFKENNTIKEENVDVSLVSQYLAIGWTFEKPEIKVEKSVAKKDKENNNSKKDV